MSSYSFACDKDCTVKLKDLNLKKDYYGYFLEATYDVDDPDSTREVYVPKIRLQINTNDTVIEQVVDPLCGWASKHYIDMGFGKLPLSRTFDTSSGASFVFKETVIEKKTKEMTLEEIEKKLGHKVKIVNR